jgi:protoporphyrinogen oxidase
MKKEVVVLGGGLSGLVVADRLQDKGYDVVIVEKDTKIGGMCKSKLKICGDKKVIYDLGPHKFATTEHDALAYYLERCKTTVKIPITGGVVLKGIKLKYPPSVVEILMKMPYHGIRCGIDFMIKFMEKEGNTYEHYLIKRVGRYTYNLVFRDYAEKIWGPPAALDEELARKRVVTPSLVTLLKNVITGENNTTFKEFFYSPLGAGYFPFKIADKILGNGGRIITSSYPLRYKDNVLEIVKPDGKECFINPTIVSTIPYNDLLTVMGMDEYKSRFLGFRDLNLFYFLVNKPNADFDCWTFFPERGVVFNRVSKNFSKFTKDCTLLCAETTKGAQINDVWAELKGAFNVTDGDLLDSWTDKIEGAYPIYNVGFKKIMGNILNNIEMAGRGKLFCVGRNACHNYNNMDHAIIESTDLANIIDSGDGINAWIKRRSEYDWKIVD